MAIELIDEKGIVIDQMTGINFGRARAGFPSSKYFRFSNSFMCRKQYSKN